MAIIAVMFRGGLRGYDDLIDGSIISFLNVCSGGEGHQTPNFQNRVNSQFHQRTYLVASLVSVSVLCLEYVYVLRL